MYGIDFLIKKHFTFLKVAKFIVITTSLYVFIFGISGLGLGMDMSGQMTNCPFSNHSMSICKMSPMEHIQEWQSMFTSLPIKDTLSIIFTLLLFIVIRNLLPRYKFSVPEIKYLYTKYLFRSNFHIYNPLKEAFSGGILNPKLF